MQKHNKTRIIVIRLTVAEENDLLARAKAKFRTKSDYARMILFGRKEKSRAK